MSEWKTVDSAPHNKAVLLGWEDWRDGQWCMEVGAYSTGKRYAGGYSTVSCHGSATHWMELPKRPQ